MNEFRGCYVLALNQTEVMVKQKKGFQDWKEFKATFKIATEVPEGLMLHIMIISIVQWKMREQ